MKRVLVSLVITLLLSAGMIATPATAELNVSLTINGNLDEIINVLLQLKLMGIGGDEIGAEHPESLQLEMRSIHDQGMGSTEEPDSVDAEVETPEPVISLENAAVSPKEIIAGGDACILSVRTVDPAGKIDTITAGSQALDYLADLHDDGRGVDKTPGDGIWSGQLSLPEETEAGNYSIVFSAYGAYGESLTTTNESGEKLPLRASAVVTVNAPVPFMGLDTVDSPLSSYYGDITNPVTYPVDGEPTDEAPEDETTEPEDGGEGTPVAPVQP